MKPVVLYLTRKKKGENPLIQELIVITVGGVASISEYVMLPTVPMKINIHHNLQRQQITHSLRSYKLSQTSLSCFSAASIALVE